MKIKKNKIINILIFLLGVFCQIQQLMPRFLMVIYLGFCLVLFLLSIKNIKKLINIGFMWYFIFVLFCLFTLLYTINKVNPDYVYIRIITYLIMFFLVSIFLDEEKNIEKLLGGFIIGGLIGITIVLFNQYNLIGIRRLGGNIYGSYAEFGAVCSLTMVSFMFVQKKIKKKKIIKILFFIYILLAIMLSGARKAILISILIPIFTQLFDKRKKINKKLIILSLVSIFSLIVIYVSLNNAYLYKFIGNRIESGISSVVGKDEEDASLFERGSFKILARQMIKERPVLGWGIHGFAIKNYYTYGKLLYSHDGFLEILSCYGLIGFILYYWIFIYIFFNYKKLLYDDVGIFLFSNMIIILLMELYSISFLNSFYVLLIGSCANIVSKRRQNEKYTQENF